MFKTTEATVGVTGLGNLDKQTFTSKVFPEVY